MKIFKQIIWLALALLPVIIILTFINKERREVAPEGGENIPEVKMSTYKDPTYSLEFSYPESWGPIEIIPGNKTCPEEDTYRTPETLTIFDQEFKFKDADLENTDSFIRSGIRVARINPNLAGECDNEVLRKLANEEITGEEFSSFRLSLADVPGFYGTHNEAVSRLDTENREQYTLFVKESDSSVLIVQPYMSFIPVADSPEWLEIDSKYKSNILKWVKEGETGDEVREFLSLFRPTAESIRLVQ